MPLNMRKAVLTVALAAGLIPVGLRALQAETTYTGKVTDDMCGAKHDMGGSSDAACVRMCVSGGSNYALVVGTRVYTLSTTDKQQRATLDKYAGERVVVKGTLSGTTLKVATVAAAHT
ncbi:MAG TPA: hypothetical protein VIC54_14165 [Terriglobales bacterium]|jgi:hypothetical protein